MAPSCRHHGAGRVSRAVPSHVDVDNDGAVCATGVEAMRAHIWSSSGDCDWRTGKALSIGAIAGKQDYPPIDTVIGLIEAELIC